ncbi:hypothetical protein C8J57DRAFT_1511707 [Mycena rebaudengoi]|nr:hypothetical protein C8J57DRAFT_1511707 [Mycena rebaudengoi]
MLDARYWSWMQRGPPVARDRAVLLVDDNFRARGEQRMSETAVALPFVYRHHAPRAFLPLSHRVPLFGGGDTYVCWLPSSSSGICFTHSPRAPPPLRALRNQRVRLRVRLAFTRLSLVDMESGRANARGTEGWWPTAFLAWRARPGSFVAGSSPRSLRFYDHYDLHGHLPFSATFVHPLPHAVSAPAVRGVSVRRYAAEQSSHRTVVGMGSCVPRGRASLASASASPAHTNLAARLEARERARRLREVLCFFLLLSG